MTKLRILLFAVFIVIVAVLIVFPYRNRTPVNIAFLGLLSGHNPGECLSACNGAMMAVEAVNAGGGIKGRQLTLDLYDVTTGPVSCRGMEEKGTDLVLASFVPGDLLRSCIKGRQVFCLGEEPGRSGNLGNDIVSLHSTAREYGEAVADLALRQGIRDMAVVYDVFYHPYGRAFLQGFTVRFHQGGGEVKTDVAYETEDREDIHGLAVEAAVSDSQGVLMIGSPDITFELGSEIRGLLPSAKLYAAPWAMPEGLPEGKGRSVEGMYAYLGSHAGTRKSEAVLDFLSEYRKRFGNPGNLSALYGYEAILILTEGIRNSASPDAFLVKHTLLKMGRFKGLMADYHLGRPVPVAETMVLHQIRKGRIIQVD